MLEVKELHLNSYYLKPGYIYISKKPTRVTTVLGSCVSFCIYDKKLKYGGINHYLMPRHNENSQPSGKFGNLAIKKLHSLFIKQGSEHKDLVASIVGGASLYSTIPAFNIGQKNIILAEEMVAELKLKVAFRDLGGKCGRRLLFYTGSNKLTVEPIKNGLNCSEVRKREKNPII